MGTIRFKGELQSYYRMFEDCTHSCKPYTVSIPKKGIRFLCESVRYTERDSECPLEHAKFALHRYFSNPLTTSYSDTTRTVRTSFESVARPDLVDIVTDLVVALRRIWLVRQARTCRDTIYHHPEQAPLVISKLVHTGNPELESYALRLILKQDITKANAQKKCARENKDPKTQPSPGTDDDSLAA